MAFSRFARFGLLVGLIILAACAPQTLPSAPATAAEEGFSVKGNSPLPEPTSRPAPTAAEPDILVPPAYPADSQDEPWKEFVRGSLEIAEKEVVITKNPLQVELNVAGNMPTPCHQLAWQIEPASQGAIRVDVYTLVDPEVICVQVLEPFDERIELARLLPGEYTVWVNGEQAGEFQLDVRAGYP